MSVAPSLAPEWQRIDLLGACVSAQRRGQPLDQELKDRLRSVQDKVVALRRSPAWERPALRDLCSLDRDILACVTAPDADPQVGWLYQELQPGVASPYPTPALVRELLFVAVDGAPAFQKRLRADAPLRHLGLLDGGADAYQPLRPTQRARSALLGWPETAVSAPGTVELPVNAGWNDLVLPRSCRQALEELPLWVEQRERVEHEWGARPSAGPLALFCGPSGTGKTLAAEVLANALGFRLLRVDLGLLVSKYIGETEKNLNALLDAVAGEPVVLLFDEADSLFGRRAEVKDARDRYANMEVSHLLTRIELHRGPCVLTTNLRQHVDAAFLRRFHAVIEFPRPDPATRAEIWRRKLPPRAPLGEGVDCAELGAAVALSGGQIHNAALRAALFASAARAAIQREHLARAVWAELAKDGRELTRNMLGSLAAHLPEGFS